MYAYVLGEPILFHNHRPIVTVAAAGSDEQFVRLIEKRNMCSVFPMGSTEL